MQQTRLETDTLALGMAKEVDSAGVATVRTREGKMAAKLRGAVPPVPGRATEPALGGKDGLETNLGVLARVVQKLRLASELSRRGLGGVRDLFLLLRFYRV